jgi:hypothetical protein
VEVEEREEEGVMRCTNIADELTHIAYRRTNIPYTILPLSFIVSVLE